MKSLKKVMAIAVLLIGIFSFSAKSFSTKNKTNPESRLNLEEINIVEMLSKQQFECRPSSEFMFYVEANLVKRMRGVNEINAEVYFFDKLSGEKRLLANEIVQVNTFKGTIVNHTSENVFKSIRLKNGDKIIGTATKAPYSLNELMQFESIYNSYISATNKLLALKRTI
ncbi:hypothetical protein K8354_15485 [Polaribacter litorisediminis]|uniref:hypothetical protein n=1 Tax=Polaribacter litorisediminis TaxID=1908341 RepID=UPI001CBE578D|nr:hypothetical protein [Polaribacter litorisediminis]UAM97680.1 hypothetical protein K8354_15485 [Polaribacter litorisediminis]